MPDVLKNGEFCYLRFDSTVPAARSTLMSLMSSAPCDIVNDMRLNKLGADSIARVSDHIYSTANKSRDIFMYMKKTLVVPR